MGGIHAEHLPRQQEQPSEIKQDWGSQFQTQYSLSFSLGHDVSQFWHTGL